MLIYLNRLLQATMTFILRHPLVFWACVVANLIGAIVGGWFWYGPMLLASPLWAAPFIPDCPLAALFGAIGLLALWAGKEWRWFYALTAFACIKYGIWTMAFWLRQWSGAGEAYPIEIMLFITHIGLFIEGLLFVPYISPLSLRARLAIIGWFGLSLFVDYGLGYYPPLSPFVAESFVMWLAIGLTGVLSFALLLLPYQVRHERVKYSSYMGMAE
jgi:uncharacterized membrane protein YpjA